AADNPGHRAGTAPARPRLRLRRSLSAVRAALPRRDAARCRRRAAAPGRMLAHRCIAEPAAVTAPLVRLADIHKAYPLPRTALLGPRPAVHAVNGVTLHIESGESLGIVGESGCGKSTLARLVMALEKPDRGTVTFRDRDLNALNAAELRAARRDFQMVFQDPYGSLDPRQKVERIVAEPLDVLEKLPR